LGTRKRGVLALLKKKKKQQREGWIRKEKGVKRPTEKGGEGGFEKKRKTASSVKEKGVSEGIRGLGGGKLRPRVRGENKIKTPHHFLESVGET